MHIVKENLFEFTRGNDPLDTLGIGYAAKVQKFFDDLGVSRSMYTIENKQIIVNFNLTLNDCTSLVELPDNLTISRWLNLKNCTNLVKLSDNLKIGDFLDLSGCISLKELPNNLNVGYSLYLNGCTSLLKLPDNLIVGNVIYVNSTQYKLIKWIESSDFYHKLRMSE